MNASYNCDELKPTWKSDFSIISDKNMLPIIGYAYGSSETKVNEEGIVTISPLTCYSKESDLTYEFGRSLNNISLSVSKLEESQDYLMDTVDEMLKNDTIAKEKLLKAKQACRLNYDNYRLIEDNCYYFEKKYMTQEDAIDNCKWQFRGRENVGILFEPLDLSRNMLVVDAAREIFLGTYIDNNQDENFYATLKKPK